MIPSATLSALFERACLLHPDRIAVDGTWGARTYADVSDRADKIAFRLAMAPENLVVGYIGEQDADFCSVVLGIWRAGLTLCPLDSSWPVSRLQDVIIRAGVAIVILGDGQESIVVGSGPTVLRLDDLVAETGPTAKLTRSAPAAAYLIPTSGSTGTPKLVAVGHEALLTNCEGLTSRLKIDDGSRVLQYHPCSIDIALEEIGMAWAVNGTVISLPACVRNDLSALLAHIERFQANILDLPTPLWQVWVESLRREDGTSLVPASVRVVGVGSSALAAPDIRSWLEFAGSAALYNLYGATETAVTSIVDGPLSSENLIPDSIGFPQPGARAYVLDEGGRRVPKRTIGELFVGGDVVGFGYWGDARMTAESYVPDPFTEKPGARMFRSGDLAREEADGRLIFLGRKDKRLTVRGSSVDPSIVVSALISTPGVSTIEVVPDRPKTPGMPSDGLVAMVGADASVAEPGVLASWREIYDAIYEQELNRGEQVAHLNTAGWYSTVDGAVIPTAQMEEWRDAILAELVRLPHHRVLELGCGTGMLLGELLGSSSRYVGVDISLPAIDYLAAAHGPKLATGQLELIQADASEALDRMHETFDLVVINSVSQHLPDLDYLGNLLHQTARCLSPHGTIFVGDVRNYLTAKDYYAWVELSRAGSDSLDDALCERADSAALRESELLISPEFFAGLRSLDGRLARSNLKAKRTRTPNEMTLFRYDVCIRLDATIPQYSIQSVQWSPGMELRKPSDPTLITGIADERYSRAIPYTEPGVDILSTIEQWTALGWAAALAPSLNYGGRIDVAACPPNSPIDPSELLPTLAGEPAADRVTNRVSIRVIAAKQLEKALRVQAEKSLLPAERPNRYEISFGSPTSKSKDKLAPDVAKPETGHDHTMVALQQIWEDVLGHQQVSENDNFFVLGGNSLHVMRVLLRLRSRFGVQVSPSEFFSCSSLLELRNLVLRKGGSEALTREVKALPEHPGLIEGPASSAQERMWSLQQMAPTSRAYHAPFVFDVYGPINRSALRDAVAALGGRFPLLRTLLAWRDVGLRQEIQQRPLALEEITVPDGASMAKAVHEVVNRSFRLDVDLPCRIVLLEQDRPSSPATLVVVAHHAVVDGSCLSTLFGALEEGYERAFRGLPLVSEPEGPQYLDYAIAERQGILDSMMTEARSYWAKVLAGTPLESRPRVIDECPREDPYAQRGARMPIAISAKLWRSVTRLAKREEATDYDVIFSAFAVFLARERTNTDIVIGAPSAGRIVPGTEDMLGFFVNTLPIRVQTDSNPSFVTLVRSVGKQIRQAQNAQALPLHEIIREVGITWTADYNPLFQTLVVVDDVPAERFKLHGCEVHEQNWLDESSTMDLSLIVSREAQHASWHFCYDTTALSEGTVRQMAQRFQETLSDLISDPGVRVGALHTRPADQSMLTTPALPHDSLRPVHEQILDQVGRCPTRVAIVSDENRVTYEELGLWTERVAHRLVAAGVLPHCQVPLMMADGAARVAAMLAVNMVGASFVPIDQEWPHARAEAALGRLSSPIVLTDEVVRTALGEACSCVSHLGSTPLDGPMYAIFTSGTTGEPKCAVNSHLGVANRFAWMTSEFGKEAGSSVLQTTAPAFDSAVWESLWPLTLGGTTVVGGPQAVSDPAKLRRLVRDNTIRTIDMVPGLLREALHGVQRFAAGLDALESLRVIVVGGEALTSDVVRAVRQSGLDVRLYNVYGPTEAAIGSVVQQVDLKVDGRQPLGRPINGTGLVLLDRNLHPVPIGAPGEICLTGRCVGLGYLDDEFATRAAFLSLLVIGDVYRTGDIGRIDADGRLEYLGRRDGQVSRNGVRIESAEIIQAIAADPAFSAAHVVVSNELYEYWDAPREALLDAARKLMRRLPASERQRALAAAAMIDQEVTA